MTEYKHTELPFSVGETRGDYIDINHHVSYAGAISGVIVKVTARQSWKQEAEANAEFIVKACNSHYELLEALQAVIDSGLLNGSTELHDKTKSRVYEAKTKATGG